MPPEPHPIPDPDHWHFPHPHDTQQSGVQVIVNVNGVPEGCNDTDVTVIVIVYEGGDIHRPHQIPIAPHSRRSFDDLDWRQGDSYTWSSVSVGVNVGPGGVNVGVGVDQYTYQGGGGFRYGDCDYGCGQQSHGGIWVQFEQGRPATWVQRYDNCGDDQIVVYNQYNQTQYIYGTPQNTPQGVVWVPRPTKAYADTAATPYEQRSSTPTTTFLGGIDEASQPQASGLYKFVSNPWTGAGVIVAAIAAIMLLVGRRPKKHPSHARVNDDRTGVGS